MKRHFAAILTMGLMALFSAPADAGGNPAEPPDAEAVIKACWDISSEKRPGTNAEIREGTLDTVLCLEERIVDQFKLFDPNLKLYHSPEDGRPTTEKVWEKLEELRFSSGALYWWIYNENPGCKSECGTMYYPFHLMENASILERMLRTIVGRRLEYGF